MDSFSVSNLACGIDIVWVLLCAALVFFMEAGFAFLEAGFIKAKSSLNIVMKVFSDTTFGMLAFWAVGFAIMYGMDKGGLIGVSGFFSVAVPITCSSGYRYMHTGFSRLLLS